MRIFTVVFSLALISSSMAYAEMSQECFAQRNAELGELKLQSSNLSKEIGVLSASVDASTDWTEKQNLKKKLDKLLLEDNPKLSARILEFLKTWKTRPCEDGSNL